MPGKLTSAIHKLFFCLGITANISSFLKITWLTKKYRWNKHDLQRSLNDSPVTYDLRVNKKPNKIFLRTYSGDIDIFYEIFWKKVYDISGSAPVDLIVDLGANIGLASLYFLLKYPRATVICVEPGSGNLGVLKKNLADEIRTQKVFVEEAAIAKADGTAFLSVPALQYNTRITGNNEEDMEVRCISMNSLLKKYAVGQIDILKIDIEGAEEDLFLHDTQWLQNVRQVIIETHSEKTAEVCRNILQANKFILQTTGSAHLSHWVHPSLL